jgi:hypothetical protein
VWIDENLIPEIQAHDGQEIVLAVSPAGLVELAQDGERWNAVFGETVAQQAVVIRPDLDKLDLGVRDFVDLDELRASDSGRIVGPKAAKLGELRHHFPEAVAPGLAIPFGVFREVVLEQPYRATDRTVFDWMVEQYHRIERCRPSQSSGKQRQFHRLRLVAHSRLDAAFQERLRAAMVRTFGSLDGLGVFIRSDTNVEDLPGFTGAGLNLTLPNVVGFDAIVAGIAQVWASPFTARSFAWRQSHMEHPEHVYPAVLLLKSVPNDKSGVMVTADIDTGDAAVLSVAVNEGVGGAVDGQAAESLRLDTRDGSVRVLATATAPWRRLPAPGGVETLPVSGDETVLRPDEIGSSSVRKRTAATLPRHRRGGQSGARGYRVRFSRRQAATLPVALLESRQAASTSRMDRAPKASGSKLPAEGTDDGMGGTPALALLLAVLAPGNVPTRSMAMPRPASAASGGAARQCGCHTGKQTAPGALLPTATWTCVCSITGTWNCLPGSAFPGVLTCWVTMPEVTV